MVFNCKWMCNGSFDWLINDSDNHKGKIQKIEKVVF